MRIYSLGIVALLGCKESNPDFCPNNLADPRCTQDAGIDATSTAPDARVCVGKDDFRVCFAQPSAAVSLADAVTIDTATDTACLAVQPSEWRSAGQPEACFIVGTTVNVPNVNVTGSRPLVLVATNHLTITGVLDVAAHSAPIKRAPGAPASRCMPTSEGSSYDPNLGKDAGGGGAGGSFFWLPGANGGIGDVNTALGGVAPQVSTAPPVVLRAGCDGQNGGYGSDGLGSVGRQGGGGGAVYLLAASTLTITATGAVNASGGAGRAGSPYAGGAGGGSGGMIVLYANQIQAMPGARLVANGGAGASGADSVGGTTGAEPALTLPLGPATSTVGCINGCGHGGSGAALGSPAEAGGTGYQALGGGGGGGGLGYIRANQPIENVATSPMLSVIP